MKMRSKLEIMALLPVIMAVALSVVLFKMSGMMGQIDATVRMADSMVRGVSDLNLATYDYLIRMDDQSRRQWELKHQAVTKHLVTAAPGILDDRGILADTRRKMNILKTTFDQMSDPRAQDTVASAAAQKELTHQLWGQSQAIVESALTLSEIARMKAGSIQEAAYMAIVAASVVLAIILVLIAMAVIANVSQGVSRLQAGIWSVASGNLANEVLIKGNDELGELAIAFNNMRTQLGQSRLALEIECGEHKKTAELLRESNRHLSDLLIKLKRAQQQLVEQERMQALKQIAGGIVHDFNNSLTPVLGTTEYLLSMPELLDNKEEVRGALKMISEAAEASRHLVRNLSEFFQPTKTDTMELVNINDLVEKAISLTKPKWKEQSEALGATITVVTELQKTSPTVHGSKIELQEALTNLILNAVDAMPTGGTISFRTRTEGDDVVIEVSDDGEGMTPDTRSRCFEPFFSTKGPKSYGMGLATAKGAIARHNGSMTLDSEPGKGTLVIIRLPARAQAPAQKAQTAPAPKPVSGLRVLVVDDEFWSRNIIERYLVADRNTVVSSPDGRDAMSKFSSGKFDLAIIDRAMPDMSGDELAIHIKEKAASVPVIMLTGFGALMAERGEHPKDVDIIVSKPFTRSEIRQAVSTVMAKRG